ncbi:MAG TPA: 4Fe-4S dicluster domain-containing protein [Anaerolineales bacterium]|nr:4Fe-4S dicluster domain-containing protein [Anaerolineales bacterium]
MTFQILPKARVNGWVDSLRPGHRLYGPMPADGAFGFSEIGEGQFPSWDYPTSLLPPKRVVLPPREKLLDFAPGKTRPALEKGPAVILGIHTCDMHALALLDRVYGEGVPDQHYLARREATTLVGIECLRPCTEHAFCKSMGTLTLPEKFDLHLTDLGEDYAVDVGSEKGEALLGGLGGLRKAENTDYGRLDRAMSEKWARFPYRLDFDASELPSLLATSYRSDLWEKLGERCLACSSCTMVCPTCTCFDVVDEVDFALTAGQRCRVWDSCQLGMFATVVGGHNFRSQRAARVRHRFLRKGKYQHEAYGLMGCVGCGRCAQSCLVHITPVDTFNALYRQRVEAEAQSAEVAS